MNGMYDLGVIYGPGALPPDNNRELGDPNGELTDPYAMQEFMSGGVGRRVLNALDIWRDKSADEIRRSVLGVHSLRRGVVFAATIGLAAGGYIWAGGKNTNDGPTANGAAASVVTAGEPLPTSTAPNAKSFVAPGGALGCSAPGSSEVLMAFDASTGIRIPVTSGKSASYVPATAGANPSLPEAAWAVHDAEICPESLGKNKNGELIPYATLQTKVSKDGKKTESIVVDRSQLGLAPTLPDDNCPADGFNSTGDHLCIQVPNVEIAANSLVSQKQADSVNTFIKSSQYPAIVAAAMKVATLEDVNKYEGVALQAAVDSVLQSRLSVVAKQYGANVTFTGVYGSVATTAETNFGTLAKDPRAGVAPAVTATVWTADKVGQS